MWNGYLAAATAVTVLGATATTATTAAPESIGTPVGAAIIGDLTGDGLTDRILLGSGPGYQCRVTVRRGLPGGEHGPRETHLYPAPSSTSPRHCPDLGAVADLGGDGVVELVLAWFDEAPLDLGYDMMVLRDFMPAGGFPGLSQPAMMGAADFNGDGLQDIFQWTAQGGAGFVNYLNTADGQLVPGPIRYPLCHIEVGMKLDDFHGDGGRGLLIWDDSGCDGVAGVSVVGADGVRVDLERDDGYDEYRWSAGTTYANGDRIRDVRTGNEQTGEVTHFLGLGDGTFVESPRALPDQFTVRPRRNTVLRVLDNDHATRGAAVAVTERPTRGQVSVNSNRSITYTPYAQDGTDRFTYRIDQDGKSHTTTVSLTYTG
jgi:hypothetical protein